MTAHPKYLVLIKQILIFVGFFFWDLLASGFIQASAVAHSSWLFRAVLVGIGLVGCFFYVKTILKTLRQRDPGFSILPINFLNGWKIWWLIRMWLLFWVLAALWGWAKVIVINGGNSNVNPSSANQQAIVNLFNASGLYSVVTIAICVVILAPIMEELLFRGLLLSYWDSHRHWWFGPVLSALLFGFAHVMMTSWQLSTFFDWGLYASLGLVLAYVYKKSGRISNSMAVHMLQNSVGVISLIASYITSMH